MTISAFVITILQCFKWNSSKLIPFTIYVSFFWGMIVCYLIFCECIYTLNMLKISFFELDFEWLSDFQADELYLVEVLSGSQLEVCNNIDHVLIFVNTDRLFLGVFIICHYTSSHSKLLLANQMIKNYYLMTVSDYKFRMSLKQK